MSCLFEDSLELFPNHREMVPESFYSHEIYCFVEYPTNFILILGFYKVVRL